VNIIELRKKIPVVSHRVMAEHSKIKHRSVRLLIDTHIDDLKEFGQVSFEMTTVKNDAGASNEAKTYYLNEPQATLLMTYLQNTIPVKTFKKALVKEFYQLKDQNQLLTESDPIVLISQILTTISTQNQNILTMLQKQNTPQREFVYVDKPTSRMRHHHLSNEEKFIAKVIGVLKQCEGLRQGEILSKLEKRKDDRTALKWLHGYDGIYWRANVIDGAYSYSLIAEEL